MRRNLYGKKIEDFIHALFDEGWKEVTLPRDPIERHFKKEAFHLILKRHSAGHYCVMHIDKFVYGRIIHRKPITQGDELEREFRKVVAQYKRLRS